VHHFSELAVQGQRGLRGLERHAAVRGALQHARQSDVAQLHICTLSIQRPHGLFPQWLGQRGGSVLLAQLLVKVLLCHPARAVLGRFTTLDLARTLLQQRDGFILQSNGTPMRLVVEHAFIPVAHEMLRGHAREVPLRIAVAVRRASDMEFLIWRQGRELDSRDSRIGRLEDGGGSGGTCERAP